MATKYIVQHRRGTAEQWTAHDTLIPKEGEIVIEIDEVNSLHKLKIGDGIHTYAQLAYLAAGDEIVTQVLAKALPRVITVELDVAKWEEVACETDPNLGYYKQSVTIDKTTKYSRLDLQPNADMLAEFQNLNLVFVTENNDGIITVYSIGDLPLKSYTMQATVIETEATVESPVIGATVGTPTTKDIIRYTPQILTEEQKAQARSNIGVGDATSITVATTTTLGGIISQETTVVDGEKLPVVVEADGKANVHVALYDGAVEGGVSVEAIYAEIAELKTTITDLQARLAALEN